MFPQNFQERNFLRISAYGFLCTTPAISFLNFCSPFSVKEANFHNRPFETGNQFLVWQLLYIFSHILLMTTPPALVGKLT